MPTKRIAPDPRAVKRDVSRLAAIAAKPAPKPVTPAPRKKASK